MPKREDNKTEQYQAKHTNLVDLDFLPAEYIRRIDDIFDAYFNLGMKKRDDVIEEGSPIFPQKVSSLSSPELGDTLGSYTAWHSYASDKHKYVVVAKNFIQQEMQKTLDFEMANLLFEKGNIESKKARARDSDGFKTILVYSQKLDGLKSLLDNELNNFSICISSLSREVSRREHNGGY